MIAHPKLRPFPPRSHPNDTVGTPKLRPVTNGYHRGHNRARVPPGPTLGETPFAPRSPGHTPCASSPNPMPGYTQEHLARSRVDPGVSRVAPEAHRTIGLHPGPPRPNPDTPCGRPGHGTARLRPGYSRATSCRTPALPGNSQGTPKGYPRPPGNTQVAPGRAGNAQVSRRAFPGYHVSLLRVGWADGETDAGHVGAGESLRGRSCERFKCQVKSAGPFSVAGVTSR